MVYNEVMVLSIIFFLISIHLFLKARHEAIHLNLDKIYIEKLKSKGLDIYKGNEMVLFCINERLEFLIQNHESLSVSINDYFDGVEDNPEMLEEFMVSLLHTTNYNKQFAENIFQKMFRKSYKQYKEERENKSFNTTDSRFPVKFSIN